MHASVHCSHARRFWEAAERFFGIGIPRLHPLSWSRDLLDQRLYKKEVAAIMITVMWAVWHSRNNYTHDEMVYQLVKSMVIIEEIVWALEILERKKTQATVPPRWLPPEAGWIKINTNGATDMGLIRGGAGFIARDHHGALVRAGGSRYDGVTDPLSIELLACRDAILMAQDMAIQQVVLETDCQEIQQLWDAPQRSTCFHLIMEMKEMSTLFQGFRLRFSGRQTNMAAHRVARHSLNLSVFIHVYDTIPGWLTDCLQSDMLAPNE